MAEAQVYPCKCGALITERGGLCAHCQPAPAAAPVTPQCFRCHGPLEETSDNVFTCPAGCAPRKSPTRAAPVTQQEPPAHLRCTSCGDPVALDPCFLAGFKSAASRLAAASSSASQPAPIREAMAETLWVASSGPLELRSWATATERQRDVCLLYADAVIAAHFPGAAGASQPAPSRDELGQHLKNELPRLGLLHTHEDVADVVIAYLADRAGASQPAHQEQAVIDAARATVAALDRAQKQFTRNVLDDVSEVRAAGWFRIAAANAKDALAAALAGQPAHTEPEDTP